MSSRFRPWPSGATSARTARRRSPSRQRAVDRGAGAARRLRPPAPAGRWDLSFLTTGCATRRHCARAYRRSRRKRCRLRRTSSGRWMSASRDRQVVGLVARHRRRGAAAADLAAGEGHSAARPDAARRERCVVMRLSPVRRRRSRTGRGRRCRPATVLDQVFRVGHHAEHVAALVEDAGDVVDRAVRVGGGGALAGGIDIAEGDPVLAVEALQRLVVAAVVAVAVGDRAAQTPGPCGSGG